MGELRVRRLPRRQSSKSPLGNRDILHATRAIPLCRLDGRSDYTAHCATTKSHPRLHTRSNKLYMYTVVDHRFHPHPLHSPLLYVVELLRRLSLWIRQDMVYTGL